MIKRKYIHPLTVMMSEELKERLYTLSEVKQVSLSTIGRNALEKYLTEQSTHKELNEVGINNPLS